MSYTLYILECADDTLYTGVTTDIERRIHEHNNTKQGARYTRSRRPVKVVYTEEHQSRSTAQKREAEIKSMKREEKQELIK